MDWKGMNVTVKLTIINSQATVEMIPVGLRAHHQGPQRARARPQEGEEY